jgi:hypothetical protein
VPRARTTIVLLPPPELDELLLEDEELELLLELDELLELLEDEELLDDELELLLELDDELLELELLLDDVPLPEQVGAIKLPLCVPWNPNVVL